MPKIALFRTRLFQLLFAAAFIIGVSISFAIDSDNDGMSDLYESFFRLNATNSTDAAENYDSDQLSNFEESMIWTDPMASDTDADGFPDDADANPLSRAVMLWGNPDYTDGDAYRYTAPDWWVGAEKVGGVWSAENGWSIGSSNEASKILISLNHSVLTNNLMMGLSFSDLPGAQIEVYLLDAGGQVLGENLSGDLVVGSSNQIYRLVSIPVADYPTASTISLVVPEGTGPFSLYTTILYIDEDQDGLDADQELQVGTSDQNPDSDGDGLSDSREVFETKSNPLILDSDGDGISDAEEVAIGTNPAMSDSDGDGLTDSEETAPRYYMVRKQMTWPEAKLYAETAGGYLAVVSTEAETLLVAATVPDVKVVRPWLGATDEQEEGVWRWINGEAFVYTRWAENEPNNYKEPQMFLRYRNKSLQWDDASASTKAAVLIEYEQGLNPLSADTDGDGLSDYAEINTYHSNPFSKDSDDDGLGDANELIHGTDLNQIDTDGDGLEDAAELSAGLDPLNVDTDGDGLGDGEEMDQRYYVVKTEMTWPEAKRFAEISGGYLGVMTSSDELYGMANIATNARVISPWLGATDIEEDGVWKWITGEAFEYTRWAKNEPNNYKEPQMYLRISTRILQWDDAGASSIAGLVIEYDQGLDPLNPDSDGDGLLDGEEVNVYGSNPHASESDADGLSDAEEVETGTDPTLFDTDGDRLSDADEIVVGTNPLLMDTDGDGISDGDEALQVYQLVKTPLTWVESKAVAENFGGHLAVVTSDEEIGAISKLLPTAKLFNPWIGASEVRDGVWQWVNGETFDYTRWDKDEPNNYKGPESYIQFINKSLKWNDAGVTVTTALLVEYAEGLDPLNPDTDGDGLLDGEEIHTYGTSAHDADSDNDGVSDGDEIALGLDPLNLDTDGDGLTDAEEIAAGLNPTSPASDTDGLNDGEEWIVTQTSPLLTDSDGNGIEDLRIAQTVNGADFEGCYGPYWFSVWTNAGTSAELSAVCDGKPAIQYQVTIEQAGIYHLGLQVDLSQAHTNALNKLPVNLADILVHITIDGVNIGRAKQCFAEVLPEYSIFTPWLSAGTHTLKVTFNKETYGISGPCRLEALEFGLVDGIDGNSDGLLDWMGDLLNSGMDSDGDGISDADELEMGTDILDSDTDGDGLADGDELAADTDPLNADSDGDGVSDGQEVNGSMTNPLVAEFDGTVTVVDAQIGAEASGTLGTWTAEGSELVAESVRGHVEYVMNFPANDTCRLVVNAAHEWTKSSCTPVIPIDTSAFLVYVDDIYVGKVPMISADGVYTDVSAFLPSMPAGEHTVRLYWENVYSRLAVKVQSLELQSLGGPDANGNGTKDWIEASISAMAGVDAVTESYVSPACIEGDARYVPFMQIQGLQDAGDTNVPQASSLPRQAAGPRWYANLSLEQHGRTTANASFQNGVLEVPLSIDWVPFNLMEHDGETILIRKGDSVKFSALPDNAHGGQFTLTVFGDEHRSPNTRPLVVAFDAAGTYTVEGDYRKGNRHTQASIAVEVIDGSFPAESPACLVGKERTWSFGGMPLNAVFEVDKTVELEEHEPSTTDQGLRTVSLKANDTNGKHVMLARLYENGPILASTELSPFWIQNAVDGYFYTVERYEDSELWEVRSVAKNVPDSVDIQIKVIVGGVTLDDYSLERWVTNQDYTGIGEYDFRLFHPNGESSTCHTFKLYQDGEIIGEAFSGGQDDIVNQ
ncbi:lectin-like protein [Pontiellaceae bacterium B12219]|nr:lectin-like protein [Pontiellaceae bacterium B12219]